MAVFVFHKLVSLLIAGIKYGMLPNNDRLPFQDYYNLFKGLFLNQFANPLLSHEQTKDP